MPRVVRWRELITPMKSSWEIFSLQRRWQIGGSSVTVMGLLRCRQRKRWLNLNGALPHRRRQKIDKMLFATRTRGSCTYEYGYMFRGSNAPAPSSQIHELPMFWHEISEKPHMPSFRRFTGPICRSCGTP